MLSLGRFSPFLFLEQRQARNSAEVGPWCDPWLVGAVLSLLALGLVMVASASVSLADRQFGQPFYYFLRQLLYVGAGAVVSAMILRTRLLYWEKGGVLLLIAGAALLVAVLIPGVGRQVNGSIRWLHLGFFNLQASELVKLFVIVYLAGYLVRRGEEVRTTLKGFLKPLAILTLFAVLLLLEPDLVPPR
jgi:cell division protein FtsW